MRLIMADDFLTVIKPSLYKIFLPKTVILSVSKPKTQALDVVKYRQSNFFNNKDLFIVKDFFTDKDFFIVKDFFNENDFFTDKDFFIVKDFFTDKDFFTNKGFFNVSLLY